MSYYKYLFIAILIALPVNVFAGAAGIPSDTDTESNIITAYYDLRERSSYIQITNITDSTIGLHVQIFQQDSSCDELNFNDELTANDTVVYDLDNIIRNNGTEVPINLNDDSYGYVVVSADDGDGTFDLLSDVSRELPLIGNFRIVDNTGYEYRTNMVSATSRGINTPFVNFNTIDGANWADVVGYTFFVDSVGINLIGTTVTNWDDGVNFDIFTFDMNEEPLSCDTRNFACGAVMNYGINEDYPASRGENLLCPGGGLANPSGGFVSFENFAFNGTEPPLPPGILGRFFSFIGFIGINNANGTGSMDAWFGFVEPS